MNGPYFLPSAAGRKRGLLPHRDDALAPSPARRRTKSGDQAVTGAAAGVYEICVKSTGVYGAIGYYQVDVQ